MSFETAIVRIPDHPMLQGVAVASFLPAFGQGDIALLLAVPAALYYLGLFIRLIIQWDQHDGRE